MSIIRPAHEDDLIQMQKDTLHLDRTCFDNYLKACREERGNH